MVEDVKEEEKKVVEVDTKDHLEDTRGHREVQNHQLPTELQLVMVQVPVVHLLTNQLTTSNLIVHHHTPLPIHITYPQDPHILLPCITINTTISRIIFSTLIDLIPTAISPTILTKKVLVEETTATVLPDISQCDPRTSSATTNSDIITCPIDLREIIDILSPIDD